MGGTIANTLWGGLAAGVLMVGGLHFTDKAMAAGRLTNQYDFKGGICNERVVSRDNWFGSQHYLTVTKEDGTLVKYSAREANDSPRLELYKIMTETSNGTRLCLTRPRQIAALPMLSRLRKGLTITTLSKSRWPRLHSTQGRVLLIAQNNRGE